MDSAVDPDLAALATVTTHLSKSLAEIRDEHWQLPTPCDDWDLRGLIDHVTGGNWFTAAILSGASADRSLSETMLRFDPVSPTADEAIQAATLQLNAFHEPKILERLCDHVAGSMQGREVLRLRLHDLIIHLWDIDSSLRPTAQLRHDLAEWGIRELSRDSSMGARHFGFTDIDVRHDVTRPDIAYLEIFGRTSLA